MLQLPDTHPQLYQEFLNGNHTVSRAKSESMFNTVSTDMALEQSSNKDMKTKGGIIGFSQDYESVEKWKPTSNLWAAVHSNFTQLVNPNSQTKMNKELSSASTQTLFIRRQRNNHHKKQQQQNFDESKTKPLH